MLNTPIILIIYKRPEHTQKVLMKISEVKPQKLFVIADGPRNENEKKQCNITRSLIENINWPCEIYKNFSDENLGLRKRISTGISWAFDYCEEAIILEDDCIPDNSFFTFCKQMLDKYRHNEKIACICGNNFQFGRTRDHSSYFFSSITYIWGWATWKRAWNNYDIHMSDWDNFRDTPQLKSILLNDLKIINYWDNIFQSVINGDIDTWDYQWLYSCWKTNSLSILPNKTLVSNIGSGDDSTHFISQQENKFLNLQLEPIDFPLIHPQKIARDKKADQYAFYNNFLNPAKRQPSLYTSRYFRWLSNRIKNSFATFNKKNN